MRGKVRRWRPRDAGAEEDERDPDAQARAGPDDLRQCDVDDRRAVRRGGRSRLRREHGLQQRHRQRGGQDTGPRHQRRDEPQGAEQRAHRRRHQGTDAARRGRRNPRRPGPERLPHAGPRQGGGHQRGQLRHRRVLVGLLHVPRQSLQRRRLPRRGPEGRELHRRRSDAQLRESVVEYPADPPGSLRHHGLNARPRPPSTPVRRETSSSPAQTRCAGWRCSSRAAASARRPTTSTPSIRTRGNPSSATSASAPDR